MLLFLEGVDREPQTDILNLKCTMWIQMGWPTGGLTGTNESEHRSRPWSWLSLYPSSRLWDCKYQRAGTGPRSGTVTTVNLRGRGRGGRGWVGVEGILLSRFPSSSLLWNRRGPNTSAGWKKSERPQCLLCPSTQGGHRNSLSRRGSL